MRCPISITEDKQSKLVVIYLVMPVRHERMVYTTKKTARKTPHLHSPYPRQYIFYILPGNSCQMHSKYVHRLSLRMYVYTSNNVAQIFIRIATHTAQMMADATVDIPTDLSSSLSLRK